MNSMVLQLRSFMVKTMSPASVRAASLTLILYLRPLLTSWMWSLVTTSWPLMVQEGWSSTS